MSKPNKPNPKPNNNGKEGKPNSGKPGGVPVKPNNNEQVIEAPVNPPSGSGSGERCNSRKWENDPEFYYTKENQDAVFRAAKLSFNKFAGVPFSKDGVQMKVGNVVVANLNPSPGLTPAADWGQSSLRRVGINQAAFDLYTEMTAQTGRSATYAPQDIATLLLAMGDMISTTEDIRRMFKILFTYQRMNWAFPQQLLEAINVDPVDFARNYASYVKRFDAVVTRQNKFHMFGDIRYFRKCKKLYSNLYKDGNSDMAQIVVLQPATIWELDETSYSGGSILTTKSFHNDKTLNVGDPTVGIKTADWFLSALESQVDAIQNSSTFQKIFADVLNYMRKMKMDFDSNLWHFDYFSEDEKIEPIYAPEVMLQIHNATICGLTITATDDTYLADKVTPYNDVYPDAGNNALLYNPAFNAWGTNKATIPHTRFIDLLNDSYAEVDTLEFTRYMALAPTTTTVLHDSSIVTRDTVTGDHYVVNVVLVDYSGSRTGCAASFITEGAMKTQAPLISQFDWAPIFELVTDAPNFVRTGFIFGDLNFYSDIEYDWLMALNLITNLSLYTFAE